MARSGREPRLALSPRAMFNAATLLFASRVDQVDGLRPLCEERVVIVRGKNEMDVREKLARYGRTEEHRYENDRGEVVEWRYVCVAKLEPIEYPGRADVLEVATRFVRRGLRSIQRVLS